MSADAVARRREAMIAAILRRLEGCRTIAVGASSPLPGTAALLARAKWGARVLMLGSRRHNGFTDGGRELFDCAAQGRIDAFFLSGGQIDGSANINLIGVGAYPAALKQRFPGSFGSAYLYFVVPRVILFREEHETRSMPARVDVVSAPGVSPPEVYRPGGPVALVTGRCVFGFDRMHGPLRARKRA
jgi:glutaconate CoA-transferase, subunit B